jgi:hypothetical protein
VPFTGEDDYTVLDLYCAWEPGALMAAFRNLFARAFIIGQRTGSPPFPDPRARELFGRNAVVLEFGAVPGAACTAFMLLGVDSESKISVGQVASSPGFDGVMEAVQEGWGAEENIDFWATFVPRWEAVVLQFKAALMLAFAGSEGTFETNQGSELFEKLLWAEARVQFSLNNTFAISREVLRANYHRTGGPTSGGGADFYITAYGAANATGTGLSSLVVSGGGGALEKIAQGVADLAHKTTVWQLNNKGAIADLSSFEIITPSEEP